MESILYLYKIKTGTNIDQLQNKFQAHVKKEIYPTLNTGWFNFSSFFSAIERHSSSVFRFCL